MWNVRTCYSQQTNDLYVISVDDVLDKNWKIGQF